MHHNIQWRPLILHIGIGIAKNSTQDSLFELLPPIITLPQLKLPTHAISTVEKMFKELLPFGGHPAVATANLNMGTNRIHERKITSMNGIMLGRMIPFSPGNFQGTGSSGCATQQTAGRQGAAVVAVATAADGAAMERLAAPVAVPKSETGCPASDAGGGGAIDESRSDADGATTVALAARLSA